ERLFSLVASLANLLDRDLVVDTIASVLGIDPVHDGDCVIFDDLAIRFGQDGKVASIFRTIDGSGLSPDQHRGVINER
ncbi:MAG: hypothetical protein GTO71_01740, partial [Woeseiaceae bacterium]|nr:hypothetical protein [Woeseiaceae bacterium]NIP19837.1 hypothetical protein [Woeseiaceae bacterium]